MTRPTSSDGVASRQSDRLRPAARLSRTLGLSRGVVRGFYQLAFFSALIAAWHYMLVFGVIPRILLPAPAGVAASLWDSVVGIFSGASMWEHFAATFSAVLVGFVAGALLGVAMGGIISEFRYVRMLMMPYVIAFNATPRIAVAPIILVWFGFGVSSKIVLAGLLALLPTLIATIAGLSASSRESLRLMRAYGSTRWQTFRKVRLYDAVPYIFAGLELGIVLSVIGAVVGEFTGGNAGLGYVILVAQESLNLSLSFAAIILLSVVGLLLHNVVSYIGEHVVYWRSADTPAGTPTLRLDT